MISRRSFLKATALTPLILSPRVLGQTTPGPNSKINVAIVGLGGRAQDIVATCLGIPELRIAAVCDCFAPRLNSSLKALADKGVTCNGYLDYQEMLEKESLDGVMAITTTHARAWVSCLAMEAGLDVYIEKPMSLTIAEGREMVKVARHYKRVTQVGTQQRSMPLNNWASDLVKNGAIGKLKAAYVPDFVSPLTWQPKPAEPMPDGGRDDWWDVWLNQTPVLPYHSELHRAWANWDAYDGGGISFGVTGWGTHSYDQLQRGLGTDLTGPVEIILEEEVKDRPACPDKNRKPGENETGAPYYGMVLNTSGPRAQMSMRFANDVQVHFNLDGNNGPGLGAVFEGEDGIIEINRDRIYSTRQDIMEDSSNPGPLSVPETQPHIENWLHCMKTRETCTADVEIGHRSTTVCYLLNIVRKVGLVNKALLWDPEAERFTNCDEANALLARERRPAYELPVV